MKRIRTGPLGRFPDKHLRRHARRQELDRLVQFVDSD
jgi:hypothetical protein